MASKEKSNRSFFVEDGFSLAHLAASRGHGECFSCLILHGASLDEYTSDRHESVFDLAKRSGKYSRIEQARRESRRFAAGFPRHFRFVQKPVFYNVHRARINTLGRCTIAPTLEMQLNN